LDEAQKKRLAFWAIAVLLVLLTLTSRICIAYGLGNDGPGDGVLYSQLAKNLLEQGVYSLETEAPFSPTLVRLPGYPLFIAGVYAIFGHDDNTTVRIVQAVIDTGTCVLIAILACLWTDDDERKRRNRQPLAFGIPIGRLPTLPTCGGFLPTCPTMVLSTTEAPACDSMIPISLIGG